MNDPKNMPKLLSSKAPHRMRHDRHHDLRCSLPHFFAAKALPYSKISINI